MTSRPCRVTSSETAPCLPGTAHWRNSHALLFSGKLVAPPARQLKNRGAPWPFGRLDQPRCGSPRWAHHSESGLGKMFLNWWLNLPETASWLREEENDCATQPPPLCFSRSKKTKCAQGVVFNNDDRHVCLKAGPPPQQQPTNPPCPASAHTTAPSTVRPLARDPWVLIGWPLPLGFGLDGRLLLARRGRVYV